MRSHSRDMVASYLVKNSPRPCSPLAQEQESSALAGPAGTMTWLEPVIVQNMLGIIHEHVAGPQAKPPSTLGVKEPQMVWQVTLWSHFTGWLRGLLFFGTANPTWRVVRALHRLLSSGPPRPTPTPAPAGSGHGEVSQGTVTKTRTSQLKATLILSLSNIWKGPLSETARLPSPLGPRLLSVDA